MWRWAGKWPPNSYRTSTLSIWRLTAYVQNHYIPTDHSQTWTGSAGASYLWNGTRFSADLIFGSGLRDGFANLTTVPAYAQVNVGLVT